MARKINQAGLDIIRECEGLRLAAYRCLAGVLTIGYGHTGPDVHEGMIITQDEAERLLASDIAQFERDVDYLTQGRGNGNQFSAMVSFAFNLGSDVDDDTIAEGLGDSTLLRKFLAGDIQGAADEFPKWNKCKGRVLDGLTKRRRKERELFLKGVA